jgi:hypothetical protein
MTRTLIDFAPPVSEILAGGRSPGTWRGLMVREGAVADWLARSSSWIGFLDDALPYVHQGPLFGYGIDVLTKDGRREDRKPERRAGRPRAEKFQAGDTVTAFRQAGGLSDSERLAPRPTGSERRWARQQAWGQPQPQAAKCLEQPSEASRELLGRLAGGAYAADVRGELKTGGRFAGRAPGKDHVFNLSRPVGPPGGIEAAEHARKVLALRLATRTAGRLHAPDVTTSIPNGNRLTSWESDNARLEDQWAASVAGPPAPAELLEPGYPRRPGKVPGIRRDEADSEANSDFEAGRGLRPTEESWLRTRRNVRPSTHPSGGRGNGEPVEAEAGGPYESAASATPAVRSRFLTSQRGLRPADAASMAVVEAVEEDGVDEEAVSHEDLSTLSAKLKQILDEEARRHGIDV